MRILGIIGTIEWNYELLEVKTNPFRGSTYQTTDEFLTVHTLILEEM